jgi:hypothetical protein
MLRSERELVESDMSSLMAEKHAIQKVMCVYTYCSKTDMY